VRRRLFPSLWSKRRALKLQLSGGLGNQLFQISAGKYFSLLWDRPLRIDKFQLKRNFAPHHSSISSFSLVGKEEFGFSPFLQSWFLAIEIAKRLRVNAKFIERLVGTVEKKLKIHRSRDLGYEEPLESVPKIPNVVVGYFQTWRYAQALFDEGKSFREDLTLKDPSPWFQTLAKDVLGAEPVSLHVRRGDYTAASGAFGLLGEEYYYQAIRKLKQLHPSNLFWVFSDEPDTARELLSRQVDSKFVFLDAPPSSDPAESLILMSMCSAHIVANSSFSWWGAFLGKGGPVIAPEKWFIGSPDPIDLIPPQWHRVPSNFEV
jgi:hypothetical protein